jgi:hypothetical protein
MHLITKIPVFGVYFLQPGRFFARQSQIFGLAQRPKKAEQKGKKAGKKI